jgi:hypothetical protein
MATLEYGPLLVAKEDATYDYKGTPVFVVKGKTIVRQGHPVLRGHENLFEPLVVHYDLPPPREREVSSPSRADHAGARARSRT